MKFDKLLAAGGPPPASAVKPIENLAAKEFGTGEGGAVLGLLMARLFRAAVLVGALALFIYIAWGGLSWITAGGDAKKIEEARDRIINGIIGMILLVATAAIAAFLGSVLGMDLLNPSL